MGLVMIKAFIVATIFFTSLLAQAQTAQDYIDKGRAEADKRDWVGALVAYNKAIELNPNDALTYIGRGSVKYLLADHSGAIQDYNKAIELGPNNADAYWARAVVKGEQGDYRGSIQDFKQAIWINPTQIILILMGLGMLILIFWLIIRVVFKTRTRL